MSACIELNKVQHQRISRKGLQTALVYNRKTTVEQQELEIIGLKRKLSVMQEGMEHFRGHCSDLHQRCDELQEALLSTKSSISDAIDRGMQLEDRIARKKVDCPEVVAKLIIDLEALQADLTDITGIDSGDDSNLESESEEEADMLVDDVVVPPAD